MRILIINGPNLNLLGTREPETYGSDTLRTLENEWLQHAARVRVGIATFQSNHEGAIIDAIQAASGRFDGIILNAGALTHYSYAIYDALVAVGIPTVEVHISNIYEREEWRQRSVTGEAAIATIYGRGTTGYTNAIDLLTAHITMPHEIHSYGDGTDHLVDVRRPELEGSTPVAIAVHGGFWRDVWKRDTMAPLCAAVTQLGWSTANIEYTRGPRSFSHALDDVTRAVEWVRDNAEAHSFDPDRIVVIGHSAGGYLALKLAHKDPTLAGAIALAPVTDLTALAAVRPDDDPAEAFIGCTYDADPGLWEKAALGGEPLVPVHLVHGVDDDTVDPSHTIDYVNAHDAMATREIIDGVGHMGVIDPLCGGLDAVYASLRAFSER
ncbi:MAG: type II 3-dehydroquinate dehydratase [Actinomycetota bacterium]